MWFNCAALHGLCIPAARMFWLFCVAWVDWVDLKWSWFPHGLAHRRCVIPCGRRGTWTSILHGRCSTNMTSWPPDRFCLTHAIGQRSWTERSCEMVIIPHDHPTGSCTDWRDLAPLQRHLLERFCVEVLHLYCQRSGAWGSCDCGSS